MAKSQRMDDILNRLQAAEEQFLASEFLAPMLPGGMVEVRIAGVICRLGVQPGDFTGWGVFRPLTTGHAQLVRPAGLAEKQRYLRLFPLVRLILCQRADDWRGIPVHQGDRRVRIDGTVPVCLVEEAQLFEVVETRFDGARFWFDRLDARHDPGAAAYLRQALQAMTEPEQMKRSGLTVEERTAYAMNYWPKLQAELDAARDRVEVRLQEALAHAGASLSGYLERGDSYRVEYKVDGEQHVSVVARNDLTVQVAGICLSGADRHFDLQSLVGVIRQGQTEGGVVPVGPANEGMEEEVYWRVHPPRRP